VGRAPWTAADALVGFRFDRYARAGPRGPARTGASAPRRKISQDCDNADHFAGTSFVSLLASHLATKFPRNRRTCAVLWR
jgi:hypothetical protein